MGAKVQKLEAQYAANQNPFKKSDLFAGISVYVNGLTNPSADEIKRIMMTHGGTYQVYHRSTTTFLICQNLPDVKIRQITSAKIISPEWIVDCVKAMKILDYSKYLLYTNQKSDQPKISFPKCSSSKSDDTTNEVKENKHETKNLMNEVVANDTVATGLEIINKQFLNIDNNSILIEGSNSTNLESSNEEKTKARTAVDPKFLSEFYNNSRLHHIATLGAGFKDYISELREKHSGIFPDRLVLLSSTIVEDDSKKVMHIDMDCFFVSVGLRSRPHLRGLPVAVTHSKGGTIHARPGADPQKEFEMYAERFETKFSTENSTRKKKLSTVDSTDSLSEIASCSYEARQMGIKNGMYVGAALKLCPNLKTIPYDFEGYKEVAYTLYNTIAK